MPIIAAPVAAWAAGAATAIGATAATAAAVGALAGAVAVGVVSGAVIGAATALVTGENILKGALKGAVVGGISAGVFSGLGMATGFAPAGKQLAALGVSPTGEVLKSGVSAAPGATSGITTPTAVPGVHPGLATPNTVAGSGMVAAPEIEAGTGLLSTQQASTAAQQGIPKATDRGFLSKMMFTKEGEISPGAGKILSGGVEGVATALATKKPDVESQSEYLAKVQAMNVSGDFQARTANIKIPDYWKTYNKITPPNLSQAQQGGSYAQPA